jgi:hypothetical protein
MAAVVQDRLRGLKRRLRRQCKLEHRDMFATAVTGWLRDDEHEPPVRADPLNARQRFGKTSGTLKVSRWLMLKALR